MQTDRQERISERAYHIWVAEGRVNEHWQRAESEIADEEIRLAAALADRAAAVAAAETSGRRKRAISAGVAEPATAAAGKSRAAPGPAARQGGRRAPNGPSYT